MAKAKGAVDRSRLCCASCRSVLGPGPRRKLSDAMRRLEALGRTYAGRGQADRLCASCSEELIWIGAALLDVRHGIAALSPEKMEDAGLTGGWHGGHLGRELDGSALAPEETG